MQNLYVKHAQLAFNVEGNALISILFSDNNMTMIQKQLIRDVKRNTRQMISSQSCDEIFVVMKYIFTNNSQNRLNNVNDEVSRLNKLILNELVPMVTSNVLQHIQYIKDINTLPSPIEHGTSTSFKGQNSLEFQSHGL